MLNKVILIGRIVKDIEIRTSASNTSTYTYFTLATSREMNREKTDFIPCVAFGSTADFMSKYLGKGSLISVEGRLEVYNRETNGNYETRVNVVVNSINALESRNRTNNQNNNTFRENDYNNVSFDNSSKNLSVNNESIKDNNQNTNTSTSNENEEFDFDNFEIKI